MPRVNRRAFRQGGITSVLVDSTGIYHGSLLGGATPNSLVPLVQDTFMDYVCPGEYVDDTGATCAHSRTGRVGAGRPGGDGLVGLAPTKADVGETDAIHLRGPRAAPATLIPPLTGLRAGLNKAAFYKYVAPAGASESWDGGT